MAARTSLNEANNFSINILPEFLRIIPQYFQKLFPALLIKEIEYLFCANKYRKMFKDPGTVKSILAIVDVNTGERDILYQCAKVLRYYFPDTRIDFICNKNENTETLQQPIKYHDNIYYLSYGTGISTIDDNEYTSGIISNSDYSVILNLSPFIDKEPFKKCANFIQLYQPFYTYLSYLSCFERLKVQKSSALHSFLHNYFSPIMLENDYPKQVKREYLLRIQNT